MNYIKNRYTIHFKETYHLNFFFVQERLLSFYPFKANPLYHFVVFEMLDIPLSNIF